TIIGTTDDLTVNVGDVSNKLDGIRGALSVNGGTGTNVLNLHDEGKPVPQKFPIAPPTITRTRKATPSYANMQSLAISAGSGSEIHLQSTAAGTSTVVGVTTGSGDSIVGPDSTTAWTVTGANAGSLSGPAFGGPVSFTGIANVIGGS